MIVLQVIFWVSLVALVRPVLYPLFVAALARLRPQRVRRMRISGRARRW